MMGEELQRLAVTVQELDRLLRSLADFRAYPKLLDRTGDAELQDFLDHIVATVRDGRTLSAKVLEYVDEAQADWDAAQQPPTSEDLEPEPPSEPPPAPRIQPPSDLQPITMANPTGVREVVLIADSSHATLHELETILTDEDYRVITAANGFEAISVYTRLWTAIDLVMLDFDLPGMSGELVFEELLAINPRVAAVASYGEKPPEKSKLNQMLARGLSGFLRQPYERDRIIHQIQSVLAHRRGARG